MMPDYRKDNPYQSLLASALGDQGIEVLFPVGYRRGLPVRRAVRDNKPIDLLHLHWTEAYAGGGSWLICLFYWCRLLLDLSLVRLAGVRIVWTLHNLSPHESAHPRMEQFMRRMLVRLATQVIVHGNQSRMAAEQRFCCPASRLQSIPHGNYRDAYPKAAPSDREQLRGGLPPDHRVVLFFGMMRPYKGIERLLRVWSQLRADQHATLRLVGPCPDSKYEDQLRRLVESSRSVEMQCGFVDDSKVAAQFAAADLAVLPFERVQTSGSVILALSFGLPVIAPRLGEVPDTLTGADDLLFEPGSDAALKQVLERALSVELTDLRRRSTAICDRLNWHSIGALTAGCYQTARKAGCPVYSA